MAYKIGALILATSKNRDDWVMMQDTYLYQLTLKTFLLTIDKEHNYIFYVGIDKDDRIFDNETQKREITRFSKVFPNVEFKFITMENIPKGYVTLMWNKLFDDAYNLGCDYFYQCGDDIEFLDNDEYRNAESINRRGIIERMENTAKAIESLANQ